MLTVRDSLEIGRLSEARILAGEHGLSREIKSVTIMDIPDLPNWLSGGELVIAGVLFQQCFSRELVDAFADKGIAGLVTKEKFIRNVPPELFDYCSDIGFPIILAPADCNWGQIMNPIINHIVQEPYLIIEEGQNFHYALLKSMVEGLSLSEMCSKIYSSTGMNLALMDNDLHLIGFSDSFDWKECTRNLNSGNIQYSGIHFQGMDNFNVYIYSYTNILLRSLRLKLLLYPVVMSGTKYGYIVWAIDESVAQSKPTETIRIQQFALVLILHFIQQNEIINSTRRFNGLVMDQLLQENDLTQERAEALLAPLDKKIHRRYYAVSLLYEESDSAASFVERNNLLGGFHNLVEKHIDSSDHILIFEKSNSQILLVPYPTDNIDYLVKRLIELFLEATGLPKVYVGISEPTVLRNIKSAFLQAGHAAGYLLSVKSDKPYMSYGDLGVLKFFMDNEGNLDERFLRSTYETYMTPLYRHDEAHKTELVRTLELYLANNCSKTETEKQLFIHKNTLRARLETINKILSCNIDCTEDLFNLQLALKLRYFYDPRRGE